MTVRAAALGVLAALAAWPQGPLAFLPPVLRWPLVAAAVLPLLRGPRTPEGRSAAAGAEVPLVLAALATFVLLKVPGIHPSATDENVYLHMAARVAAAEVPYRDFFFAHPPLHLALPALVFRLSGFSIPLAKLLPVAAQAAAALLLWAAARTASRPYALAALVLHLTAYQVLTGASDLNGGNLASLLLAAALLAGVRGAPLVAGALGGLAIGTVLYALSGALAAGLVPALRGGGRAAARYAAGLAAAVVAVLGAAWATGGAAFLHGVFGFHAARPAGAGRAPVIGAEGLASAVRGLAENLADVGSSGWRATYFHAPVAAALAAAVVVLAVRTWRRRGAGDASVSAGSPGGGESAEAPAPGASAGAVPGAPRPVGSAGLAAVGLAGAALALLQSGALPEVHAFYALPAMPFVALAAAYGPLALAARIPRGGRGAVLAAAGLAAVAAHPLLARLALARAFPEEARAAGAVARYAWPDPEVPAALARASRAVAWTDARERGRVQPPWRHAVWSKAAAFSSAREIAAYVRAETAEEETVTGASTLAPLVALLAGRRMAAGEVDTNAKRFAAGSLDEDRFLRRILADGAAFVVSSPRSFFTVERLEGDPRWAAAFARDRAFLDEGLGRGEPVRVVLYRRRR